MKRRTLFVASQTKAAKQRGRDLAETYQFWFRRKFVLSPRDPRFLELTPEEVEAEYWAWHYADSDSTEEYEDDDFDAESILASLNNEDEWEPVIDEH